MKTQAQILSVLTLLMITPLVSFGQCDVDFTKPHKVGTFILKAIKENNADALKCTFNKVNQNKSFILVVMIKECQKITEGVNKISEVRIYERGKGVDWTVCKLKVINEEVMVITLTLENGMYRFEDINSPSVSAYEKLPLINIKEE